MEELLARCQRAEAERDAYRERALAAEQHAAELVVALRENTAELARMREQLTSARQEIADQARATRALLTQIWDRLESRLFTALQQSNQDVDEFRDLLTELKATTGSTQPQISHKVLLATTDEGGRVKYQIHTGASHYIEKVKRMYGSSPRVTTQDLGEQGNGVSMRRYIRQTVEPQLEQLLESHVSRVVS